MTPKQERFVAEYLVELNATAAAVRAGYSAKTATVIGSRLLAKPAIAAAIAARNGARLKRVVLKADAVLEEVRRVAFSDPRRLFDEAGNLKPIHEPYDETASALASIEVSARGGGSRAVEDVHKVRLWNKPQALWLAARHLGLTEPTAIRDKPQIIIVNMGIPRLPKPQTEELPDAVPVAPAIAAPATPVNPRPVAAAPSRAVAKSSARPGTAANPISADIARAKGYRILGHE